MLSTAIFVLLGVADRPHVEFSLADAWNKAEAYAAMPSAVPVPVAMSKR
jgi:hypothetical protein